MDLSKAFDSLSHTILISKLRHYGICDVTLKLMKSYLENQKQYVQFDTCTSDMKSIRNGIPQGSILGPLLFFIYINDFPNSSKLFNFLMYADDTTLFCCLEDITFHNKELVLNNELQRVHLWLKANRLSLNVKKTKYMLFCKQKGTEIKELNLRISNDAIQSVNNFNFLGLHINSKLNWDTHQGWGQVQLTKYSSTPSTPNVYQVQVLVKYSFFLKVLKYIKYFHIKYKYKYKYSH